jgi:hypothetical protein
MLDKGLETEENPFRTNFENRQSQTCILTSWAARLIGDEA